MDLQYTRQYVCYRSGRFRCNRRECIRRDKGPFHGSIHRSISRRKILNRKKSVNVFEFFINEPSYPTGHSQSSTVAAFCSPLFSNALSSSTLEILTELPSLLNCARIEIVSQVAKLIRKSSRVTDFPFLRANEFSCSSIEFAPFVCGEGPQL